MIVMSNFMAPFNIYFESVFDKGVDRRHFYTNFREISKQILGDFFTKTVAYLKYHFDNDYLHYHIESENFYLLLRDTSLVFLAIHKLDVTKYFKDEYGCDLKIVDSFIEPKATGKHKKLSKDGIVGVEIKVQ